MHKRRVSDDILSMTESMNRKKLSNKFMQRLKDTGESPIPLHSTAKIERKAINFQPVATDMSIASIIQGKVASLKNKFGELDDMRKRLIDSRCEVREDQENRRTSLERSRGRSFEFSAEAMITRDFNQTKNRVDFNLTKNREEKIDIDLRNERKSAQKAILEKNLIERESLEKQQSLLGQVKILTLESDKANSKILSLQKDLKDSENIRKHQESLIRSQSIEIENLDSHLSSSASTIKSLKTHITKLENKLKSINENSSTTTTAIKNLSYIILSKDSPTRAECSTQQIINKYLESLREVQSSNKLLLSILDKLDQSQFKQAHQKLSSLRSTILKQIEKSNWDVDELEKAVYECRSPSPTSKKASVPEGKNAGEKGCEYKDLIDWMGCQASMIEDLLMISELGATGESKLFSL